jgi:hypothetical protein
MDMTKSRLTPLLIPEYGTCSLTHAGLRIYSDSVAPDAMTAKLGLEPQWTMTKGLPHELPSGRKREATVNGWFLSSKDRVTSRDLRDHLDWLLDRLGPAAAGLRVLQAEKVRMAVSCRWDSVAGHSGPTLWPEQMRRLAELNLECRFRRLPLRRGRGRTAGCGRNRNPLGEGRMARPTDAGSDLRRTSIRV